MVGGGWCDGHGREITTPTRTIQKVVRSPFARDIGAVSGRLE